MSAAKHGPQHSPGPWDITTTRVVDRDGMPILLAADDPETCTTADTDEANMILAAAAPALVEALLSIIDLKAPFSRDPLQRAQNAVAEAQRIALDALTKASVLP